MVLDIERLEGVEVGDFDDTLDIHIEIVECNKKFQKDDVTTNEVNIDNKYDLMVVRKIENYCKNILGMKNVTINPLTFSYLMKFDFPNEGDMDEYLKLIRRILYKFSFFLYSIQVEDYGQISLKLKYRDFERFTSLFAWESFPVEDKFIFGVYDTDSRRTFLRFSFKIFNLYREKEKPIFESIMKRYQRFIPSK